MLEHVLWVEDGKAKKIFYGSGVVGVIMSIHWWNSKLFRESFVLIYHNMHIMGYEEISAEGLNLLIFPCFLYLSKWPIKITPQGLLKSQQVNWVSLALIRINMSIRKLICDLKLLQVLSFTFPCCFFVSRHISYTSSLIIFWSLHHCDSSICKWCFGVIMQHSCIWDNHPLETNS